RRFGFLGISGLIRIVIFFTALVYVLVYLNRGFESFLTLDPALILRGQVWRLVTYIFIPQTFSPLWVLLALWFLWFIGEGLERAWGPFRLTLYFFVGMIGTTVGAFFFGAKFSNGMLIASLFFAFARFYPDEVIYVLFILPVKIKWLAWVFAAHAMAKNIAWLICQRRKRPRVRVVQRIRVSGECRLPACRSRQLTETGKRRHFVKCARKDVAGRAAGNYRLAACAPQQNAR